MIYIIALKSIAQLADDFHPFSMKNQIFFVKNRHIKTSIHHFDYFSCLFGNNPVTALIGPLLLFIFSSFIFIYSVL